MTRTGNTAWEPRSSKKHTGLDKVLAGKPGDRNSAATDNKAGAIKDPADMVESGIMAGGTAGIAEGGKESRGGI
jgi:hypothetical protein